MSWKHFFLHKPRMAYLTKEKLFTSFLLISILPILHAASMNDTKTLLSDLLSDYNKEVRPIREQFSAINVTIIAYMKSIQEFDEVQEKFSFVGALAVSWLDANMVWNPYNYGGLWQLPVSYKDVWVPDLILSSPSEAVNALGKSWNKVRYYNTGHAIWVPVDLIESTCSVNVRNYPFDTQECVTSFNSMGYEESEVLLIPGQTEFDLGIYQENSLWAIARTKVSVQTIGTSSQIDLVVSLKRKPSFVVINVILPILFLSLLNTLVFLLVPESGERVSYCVTVLLAVAVFMTIVSDMLPRSSEPVPLISYKLMVDMIISSLIVVVTILNLRVYNKDKSTPVPTCLKALYNTLSCRKCKSTKVFTLKSSANSSQLKGLSLHEVKSTEIKGKFRHLSDAIERADNVTWKQISFMVDWICFTMFSSASILSFVCFIATTYTN